MAHAYQFGPFELVPDRSVLLREGTPVRLGSRAFAILVILVENADRIVPNEELIARVWPHVNVSDSNLRVHLAAIRKVLSDCNEGHEGIVTAPGIGYRFAMPVTVQKVSVHQRSNSNVPAQLVDLIGRDAVIRDLLESVEKYRFVSIIGSGGIGKTSVALAVARKAMERYSEGACFVDLAPLENESSLHFAVSSALKLQQVDGDQSAIIDALRPREMLLLLDNCEHVIERVASLAEAILRECLNVHLLTTSREPLRAEGEFVRRLLPLQSPPSDDMSLSASDALAFPAAELFVERARAGFPGFCLPDGDGLVLAEICNKLDGIPLAIELAASRIDLFDLRKLAKELDHSLQILTRGRRTAQERHRTLRATLDWSFRLLTEEEQALFVRLGVFRNAFDRDAALAVALDPQLTKEQVLDGLANLAAKSLLVVSSENNMPLYRLLESTRAYASEKLSESTKGHMTRGLHANYLLQRLEQLDTKLVPATASSHGLYGRLVDEIRAAIAWSFSYTGGDAIGVRLITSSAYLWSELSLFEEYKFYADQALQIILKMPNSASEELKLLNATGPAIYETFGSIPELYTTANRVLELATVLDDRQAETGGLHNLWRYHHGRGEYAEALEITDRIRQSLESSGNGELWWKPLRGLALLYQGNLQEAQATLATIDKRIPFPDSGISASSDYNVAVANGTLARTLWLQGMVDSASLCADAALESALRAGQAVSICFTLAIAGCSIALWNRDLCEVERCLSILREHAMRAKSAYWFQYVNVFEIGLLATQAPQDSRRLLTDARTSKWDYRHWENFSVLGEGFAPPEFLRRAKHDARWWCSSEILRLEAHRICRESVDRNRNEARELFCRALRTAQEQRALAWELRLAMSISRIRAVGRGQAEGKISSLDYRE